MLYNILSNVKIALSTITKANGYNYNIGSINEWDSSKFVYPAVVCRINEDFCLDDIGAAGSDLYYHQSTLHITVYLRVDNNNSVDNSYTEYYKFLDDLLKLFGTNYTINNSVDICLYKNMQMNTIKNGDILIPICMDVYFTIRWETGRKIVNVLV